jgi:hypothetical protein
MARPPKDPWLIHFFQRHEDDDPARSVPAFAFLDALPKKVRADIEAVLAAVAEAPPPAFSGGGKWEVMHADMAGFYEVRVRASFASTGSRSRAAQLLARRTTSGQSGTPPSSGSGGPCSSRRGRRSAGPRLQLEIERSGERQQGAERRVRILSGENTPNRLRFHASPPSELSLGHLELAAALVESAHDRVDLIDALPRLLICRAVLRVLMLACEVALGTGAGLSHELQHRRNFDVTRVIGSGGGRVGGD